MENLADWGSLQALVARVPRGGPGYSTNLYAGEGQVGQWCANDQLRTLVADGTVLVVRADRDFSRVYHVARDMPSLTHALAQLPAGRYATDIIGREQGLGAICDAYAAAGFVPHAFLRRMSRAQATDLATGAPCEALTAVVEDASAVAAFLDRLLDRFTEQLPELDELRDAANDGRLLIVRRDELIAGMLMYDIQGQLAHLRFWHVDPDAQGEGIGRRLMADFVARCAQARRIVLWVIGDNDRSIAIYRHYGFEVDGLLDRIMILNKDTHS